MASINTLTVDLAQAANNLDGEPTIGKIKTLLSGAHHETRTRHTGPPP